MFSMNFNNTPDFWIKDFPVLDNETHKYSRGQAIILASESMTGATVLAASSCARVGAGIVRVMALPDMVEHYQSILPPHIIVENDLESINDERSKAVLLGAGTSPESTSLKICMEHQGKAVRIMDAGALDYIANNKQWGLLENSIITPHKGEFDRVFGNNTDAESVARKHKCIVVLKGGETHITNGKDIIVNAHSSPYLATAGTGDVLGGIICGLTAQGMEPLKACAAAVWLHGEAGIRLGAGMVASDIVNKLPEILKEMLAKE